MYFLERTGNKDGKAGNAINMIRIVPTQAIELETYKCETSDDTAKEKWSQEDCPNVQIGPVKPSLSLHGCHLGGAGDRLTISPDVYPNLSIVVQKMCKSDGIGTSYSGLSPTLLGMLPYITCYNFMYDTSKKSYCTAQKKKKALSCLEMPPIGAL
ncbi:hypothetical protein L1987_49756 [Smallanthus sonchifolius]|uniref:Uncharacterized protein n=1 Tax=Smallanthus sonchifolius TaxID=185202 RepID=A0ACB9FVD6_9ASTR|nr:hypothetical protein L1987_49756 [Smallanthus sonchifolius]